MTRAVWTGPARGAPRTRRPGRAGPGPRPPSASARPRRRPGLGGGVVPRKGAGGRERRRGVGQPRAGDEDGRTARLVVEVDGGERDVPRVPVQDPGRVPAGGFGGALLGRAEAEVAQGREPPLADQPLRRFRAGAEDALDRAPVLPEDRAVAEGEVHLLARQPPVEEQLEVLDPGRLAGQRLVEQRADRPPDLGPGLAPGRAERGGVLGPAEERRVGVVVDQPQLGTEEQDHREARVEAEADRGRDAPRPRPERPQGRRRPVLGAHQCRDLPAPAQKVGIAI